MASIVNDLLVSLYRITADTLKSVASAQQSISWQLDTNSYYWIYSTMLQTLAALIGVVGLFVVYRLQSTQRDVQEREEVAKTMLRNANYGDTYSLLSRDIETTLVNAIQTHQESIDTQLALPENRGKQPRDVDSTATTNIKKLKYAYEPLHQINEDRKHVILAGSTTIKLAVFALVYSAVLLYTNDVLVQLSPTVSLMLCAGSLALFICTTLRVGITIREHLGQ